ncbi:hypothetical protein SeMB42_g07478 [Synchytrium endobioticum]|uniref:Uncharacterized protein n=1 Tax=Synchytrium endobioticum TaxID=286115 RepID=A0A507C307_9FUNG|nr:hypothetical protein SeMB42_g07478 [Synchytrium endobioticum]
MVAQLPQSDEDNPYADDWWDKECALNQGGGSDGRSHPDASTLENQELYGGASGMGHRNHHGAGYTSASQDYAPMDHTPTYDGGQTSADQIEPQNRPVLPFPEQTARGYDQEHFNAIVARPPQFNYDSIHAGHWWGDEWALNQGGGNGGAYLAYEAYSNQPGTSTLSYQEFPGGASGLGHDAKHSSVYEESTLMHDSYLYHGGQTSVDQIEPQNLPVLPFPEQTPGGHNQEDLYTAVTQRPKSINNIYAGDSWGDGWALNQGGVDNGPYLASEAYINQPEASTLGYQEFPGGASGMGHHSHHGAGHTSASQDYTPMHPRDHGSEIGQNSVHDNTAHKEDHYTLAKYGKGPFYVSDNLIRFSSRELT